MRSFFVIFAIISIVNAQAPPIQVNGSASASLNPGQIQIQGDTKPNQNENNGQPSVSVQGQINSQQGGVPGQSASGDGGATDIGSFLQGISNGVGEFIKGFAKPIDAVGKTFCFGINSATNQAIRFEDFVGQTFSVSVNGTPVYSGTIQPGGKLEINGNGQNGNGQNGNGQNGNGQNATKRHHHERHHFESKKISNLFNKLRDESRHGGDKKHHERSDSH